MLWRLEQAGVGDAEWIGRDTCAEEVQFFSNRRAFKRGEGDYGRLTTVLEQAFGGTTQPLPGQGRTTIWYLEDGFQTRIPVAKRRLYSGAETDKNLLPAAEQAAQLQGAIALAYCQPNVGAFFNFQLLDDHSLNGWQSGVLWADGTQKPAYPGLRDAIAAVQTGSVDCGQFPAQ